jgi:hypothetical protein
MMVPIDMFLALTDFKILKWLFEKQNGVAFLWGNQNTIQLYVVWFILG